MTESLPRVSVSGHRQACAFAALLLSLGAVPDVSSQPLRWTAIDSLNARLPESVRIFEGRGDSLRAWYVRIRESDPLVETRVEASDDADGKETTSEFATDPGVCVAVNGGYFDMTADPATHVGLLLAARPGRPGTGGTGDRAGRLVADATGPVQRDTLTYVTARAALGFTADDRAEIAWASARGDSLFAWADPPPHRRGALPDSAWKPVERRWAVRTAIGAGPMLIEDGRIRITADEEVFFGTSIPRTHPRTAAGITADGDLLLLVVDGRQPASRGVNLEELAAILWNLDAVDALNLDGGGSSTMVVAGVRLNSPVGGAVERPVVSALVTTCR